MASYHQDDFRSLEAIGLVIFEKNDPGAQLPTLTHIDAFAGLTIVKRTESRVEDRAHFSNEFSLGYTLKNIRPLFYLSISGTPELTQRGYFLLNGPIIVMPDEEVRVFLFKFDESAPDLELPFTDGLIMRFHRKFVCDFSFPASVRQEVAKKPVRRQGRRLEQDEDYPW
jgi:hypothetical protein